MGVYLPKPNTEKISYHGGKEPETLTSFGLASMQGWRQSMEDAHISIISLSVDSFLEPLSVYGVFDGHGGSAVSLWVANRFESVFCHELTEAKKRGNFPREPNTNKPLESRIIDVCEALRQTYLTLDKLMDRSEVRDELKKIYEAEESKKETNANLQNAPLDLRSEDSLLDSWLMSITNQRQFVQIFEKNGQKFYKVWDSSDDSNKKNSRIVEEGSTDLSDEEGKSDSQQDDSPVAENHGTVLEEEEEEGKESKSCNISQERGKKSVTTQLSKSEQDVQDETKPQSSTPTVSCPKQQESEGDTYSQSPESREKQFVDDNFEALEHPSSTGNGNTSDYYENNDDEYLPLDESRSQPYQPEGCGCTAVVVVVVGDENPTLITANAGDSRAVLCRNNHAIALSRDHKPGLPRETKRIYDAGGTVSFGRVEGNLNLSRALGDLCYKSDPMLPPEKQKISGFPDVSVVPLCCKDQFVILACDGIWDCLSNQEAVDFVLARLSLENHDSATLSKICEEMCDHCLCQNPFDSTNGIGCDNMTVIIVSLSNLLVGRGTTTCSTKTKKCLINYDISSSDMDDNYDEEMSVDDL